MGKKKKNLKTYEVSASLIDSLIKNMNSMDGVDWVDDLGEGMNMLASIHMDFGALSALFSIGLVDSYRYYDLFRELLDAEMRLKKQMRSLLTADEDDDTDEIFNEYE